MLISILTGFSILTAVSNLSVVYSKVLLPLVFILTVGLQIVSRISDSCQLQTVHIFIFMLFFISAYSAVRVTALIKSYGKESNRCKLEANTAQV